jgi:hypothetical protein
MNNRAWVEINPFILLFHHLIPNSSSVSKVTFDARVTCNMSQFVEVTTQQVEYWNGRMLIREFDADEIKLMEDKMKEERTWAAIQLDEYIAKIQEYERAIEEFEDKKERLDQLRNLHDSMKRRNFIGK